jgi:glutamate/aspartate transport system permease protein
VSLFRNIPLLVQMFLWFFVLPEVLPATAGHWLKRGLPVPEFFSAVVCLGLFTSARVAEQVRSGIIAVGEGQIRAALALGITRAKTYRYVLLPNAYRTIIPVMTSEFLTIFKNSSVALTIGVAEVTAQSRRIAEYTFHSYEVFALATAIYIFITSICIVLMRIVEHRTQLPGLIGSEGGAT